MDAGVFGAKLRECRYVPDCSTSCRRTTDAFALIDCLDTLPEISIGSSTLLGERVTVVLSTGTADGNIRNVSGSPGASLEVVMDSGEVLYDVSERDVIGLVKENNAALDYVSRIIWAMALSESRIPLTQAQMLPDYSPWEMCELAFHLTQPWNADLFSAPHSLPYTGFGFWIFLFAESIRMKAQGSLMLSLRIVEECSKQLLVVQDGPTTSADYKSFISGISELVKYYPMSVFALGGVNNSESSVGTNGGFSLLLHMVSAHAVKVLKAVYRQPAQKDMGTDVVVDRALLKQRICHYVDLLRSAEDQLRARKMPLAVNTELLETVSVVNVFGDGQSSWHSAWLCSLDSDAAGVCKALRRAIELADANDNNDFVSAKARWDLAGYLTLGGEGDKYDLRVVKNLGKEAETYADRVDILGMKFFINGESFCGAMVKAILEKYNESPPHIVAASKLTSSRNNLNSAAAPQRQDVCANCQKSSGKLMACGKCRSVKYCSRECQVAHFKSGHKNHCKAAV